MNWENISIPNAVADSNPILRQIYARFGFNDTLLFPLKSDGSPNVRFPEKATIEQSHSAQHLRDLTRSTIAVMCGQRSGHLCCILCTPDAMEELLPENPFLSKTLQAKSPSGCIRIFLRIDGNYPTAENHAALSWFPEGLVTIHEPHDNSGFEFLNDHQPLTVAFDEIVWPPNMAFNFKMQKLQKATPLVVLERGQNILNDHFVVQFFGLQKDVSFDPASRIFYRPSGDAFEQIWPEVIKAELLDMLRLLSQAAAGQIVVDMSPRRLKVLVQLLEIACVAPMPDMEGSLAEFVSNGLVQQPNNAVTVEELFPAYSAYCTFRQHRALTQHQFQDRIGQAIKNRFGVGKSNDIKRGGGCHRGFRNLAIVAITNQRTDRTVRTGGETSKDQFEENIIRLFKTETATITAKV